MGALIESESHQCFRFDLAGIPLSSQIRTYFSSHQLNSEADNRTKNDPQMLLLDSKRHELHRKLVGVYGTDFQRMGNDPHFKKAKADAEDLGLKLREYHLGVIMRERLTVLESVLRLVQHAQNFSKLRADLRRYLAEAQVMLDIAENPTQLVPIEEPLLQEEVLDRLLPRLADRFPQQEKDLVKAYHDLIQGGDTDTVFVIAVKALEEISRGISGNPKLTLDDQKSLKAAFPELHATILTTITKLAAHRGDKAGHGRQGPPSHEMRYLMFSICNVALLFLDYPVQSATSTDT
jgi:hypothetical protein